MRLLCVNNKPVDNSYNYSFVLSAITEGEVYEGYEVEGVTPNGDTEKLWRIPSLFEDRHAYAFERFVPLPDEPAEVIEEQETELQTA